MKKSAVKITDQEMKSMEAKEKENAKRELEQAVETAALIYQLPPFQIKKKVGANRQLFGNPLSLLKRVRRQ